MAIGYGEPAPKPAKGSNRSSRRSTRNALAKKMRDIVWDRTGGFCEVCGKGPLLRTLDALDPRAGHVAHNRGRRVAPADRFNPDACKLACVRCHLAEHHQRF
jgi:5-methylcytosine-specific restriction endonuclease McrA